MDSIVERIIADGHEHVYDNFVNWSREMDETKRKGRITGLKARRKRHALLRAREDTRETAIESLVFLLTRDQDTARHILGYAGFYYKDIKKDLLEEYFIWLHWTIQCEYCGQDMRENGLYGIPQYCPVSPFPRKECDHHDLMHARWCSYYKGVKLTWNQQHKINRFVRVFKNIFMFTPERSTTRFRRGTFPRTSFLHDFTVWQHEIDSPLLPVPDELHDFLQSDNCEESQECSNISSLASHTANTSVLQSNDLQQAFIH